MYKDPIYVRLKMTRTGVFVPISLWRTLKDDGTVQEGGGSIEPALHTRAKGDVPCALPSESDKALGRSAALHSTLYDEQAKQAAKLTHDGACTVENASLSASTFGIGYGSPTLEQLVVKRASLKRRKERCL